MQGKAKQSEARQGKAAQGNARQGVATQGVARQGVARQGGHGKAFQDKPIKSKQSQANPVITKVRPGQRTTKHMLIPMCRGSRRQPKRGTVPIPAGLS